jgi:hypothetical protein
MYTISMNDMGALGSLTWFLKFHRVILNLESGGK